MGQANACQLQGPAAAANRLCTACTCMPGFNAVFEEADLQTAIDNGPSKVWIEIENRARLTFTRHRLLDPVRKRKGCGSVHDHYTIEGQIGHGTYGSVFQAVAKSTCVGGLGDATERSMASSFPADGAPYSARDAPFPRRLVAVKAFALEPQRPSGQEAVSPNEKVEKQKHARYRSFKAERTNLAKLEHPHIVRMFETFEEENGLYIVMELCRGGELYERVAAKARKTGGGGYAEPSAKGLFRQMLSAVNYLHAIRIVHRDIKTENFLLLDREGTADEEIVKLCDFGTAVQLSETMPRSMERTGTLSYTAPEVYANKGAALVADCWSLGVVLYVVLVGASPFRTSSTDSREETMQRIQLGAYDKRRPAWTNLSAEAKGLVQRLLDTCESTRLPSAEALRHAWVTKLSLDNARPEFSAAVSVRENTRDGVLMPNCAADGRQVCASSTLSSGNLLVRVAPQLFAILVRYARLDPLQHLILIACAQLTPDTDILRFSAPVPWHELFWALDSNEDGMLDFDEFCQGLKRLLGENARLKNGQLETLARILDVDGSGGIDWIEWVAVALFVIGSVVEEPEPLTTAFRVLDSPSGDCLLGIEDFVSILGGDEAENGYAMVRMADCKVAIIPSEDDDICPAEERDTIHKKDRSQISALLQRWASRRSTPTTALVGSHGESAALGPTLTIGDLRRALESVAWRMDEEVGLERRPAAPNVSAFPCVSVSRMSIEPVSRVQG